MRAGGSLPPLRHRGPCQTLWILWVRTGCSTRSVKCERISIDRQVSQGLPDPQLIEALAHKGAPTHPCLDGHMVARSPPEQAPCDRYQVRLLVSHLLAQHIPDDDQQLSSN